MLDRQLPHSLEAEESVLGSILIDGECFTQIKDTLQAKDFYRDKNQWVFEAIQAVNSRKEAISSVTVNHELEQKGRSDAGGAYLSNLILNVPTSVHIKYYAQIVLQASKQRQLIVLGGMIADIGYTTPDFETGATQALNLVLQHTRTLEKDEGLVHISTGTGEAWENLTALINGDRQMPGITTGFRRLDRVIGGWEKGVYYIIAGRPGMGKSHLMLCSAMAATQENPAGIFSLEMTKAQVSTRLAYMLAGLNKDTIEQRLFDNDFKLEERVEIKQKITTAMVEVNDLPIYIDGRTTLTTTNMIARIERFKAEHNLGVVFVDHLGKANDSGKSLYEKTTLVSGRLAQMAKDCDVPVVCLCQLNRESESRERKSDRRPRLSDLRESGAIEQDARVVLGLYRDDYYIGTDENFNPIFPGVDDLLQVILLKANERKVPWTAALEIDPISRKLRDWPHDRDGELKKEEVR